MKITQWICRAGGNTNEDAFWQGEDCALVLDGSTGLVPEAAGYSSDIFVSEIIRYFSKFLQQHPEADLRDALKHAVCSVRAEYEQRTGGTDPQEIPVSASVVAVREREGLVEVYCLGDCTCMLHTDEGCTELYQDGVARLDSAVLSRMRQIHELTGEDVSDIVRTPEIRQLLTANRRLMNTPEGYYILSFDDSVIDMGLSLTLSAEKLSRAYLFSDGFALARDAFLSGVELSLDALYADIRNRENADSGQNKYPRFKLHDDATAVEIIFGGELKRR